MSRYKGRQSAKAVEKDFRHFVNMVVPPGGLGNRLDAMYEFQTARQLKHFRAPQFAFASVFTRASDGGIQGTMAKLKARPRRNPANIFRSKYFNSLCRWRANGVRRLPCQSLTNAHLEMMLYIPGAGGAGRPMALKRIDPTRLDHYKGKFECETCGRTKRRVIRIKSPSISPANSARSQAARSRFLRV